MNSSYPDNLTMEQKYAILKSPISINIVGRHGWCGARTVMIGKPMAGSGGRWITTPDPSFEYQGDYNSREY